jgi:hypothetical protein
MQRFEHRDGDGGNKWEAIEYHDKFTSFRDTVVAEILQGQVVAYGRHQFAEGNSQRKTDVSEADDCDYFHGYGFQFMLRALACKRIQGENAMILTPGEQEDGCVAFSGVDSSDG